MKMRSKLTDLSYFKLTYFVQLSCTVEYGAFCTKRYEVYKLLSQFSMDHFQTLYTCACWSDIINVHAAF